MTVELDVTTTPIDITDGSTSIDLEVVETPIEISTTDGPTVTVSTSTIEIEVVSLAPELTVETTSIEIEVGGGGGGGGTTLPAVDPGTQAFLAAGIDGTLFWIAAGGDPAFAGRLIAIDNDGHSWTLLDPGDLPLASPNVFQAFWPDTGGADVDTIREALDILAFLVGSAAFPGFGGTLNLAPYVESLWPGLSSSYGDSIVGWLTMLMDRVHALENP